MDSGADTGILPAAGEDGLCGSGCQMPAPVQGFDVMAERVPAAEIDFQKTDGPVCFLRIKAEAVEAAVLGSRMVELAD